MVKLFRVAEMAAALLKAHPKKLALTLKCKALLFYIARRDESSVKGL
jgi:hypothetical protein